MLGELPPYRGEQIFRWINRGIQSFREMSNLPLGLREDLEREYVLYSSQVSRAALDRDGAEKLQITLQDGLKIEAVILKDDKGRRTACLSTQAGCPMGCLFCKTGSLGFQRNLSGAEIAEQFLHIRRRAPGVSHIVIMGMGEPLLNLAELRKALGRLCGSGGLGLGFRRVTLSTAGIAGGIRDLAEGGPDIRLALSLTAAEEKLRKALMPVTETNPLPLVRESLCYYQERRKRRITLEAVLFSGVNTADKDARALGDFIRGGPPGPGKRPKALDCVVNLIPWNHVENLNFRGRAFRTPGTEEINRFASILEKQGIGVTRRYRRGAGISGACGQLGELS
jgi:23S rRNA (adenine2503-C2)-methyltransferase